MIWWIDKFNNRTLEDLVNVIPQCLIPIILLVHILSTWGGYKICLDEKLLQNLVKSVTQESFFYFEAKVSNGKKRMDRLGWVARLPR